MHYKSNSNASAIIHNYTLIKYIERIIYLFMMMYEKKILLHHHTKYNQFYDYTDF